MGRIVAAEDRQLGRSLLTAYEQALTLRTDVANESSAATEIERERATTQLALGRLLVTTAPDRSAELIDAAMQRIRVASPSAAWRSIHIRALVTRAEAAAARAQVALRRDSLAEARVLAEAAHGQSTAIQPTCLQLAEVHAALAAAAAVPVASKASWNAVRTLLEPGRSRSTPCSIEVRARSRTLEQVSRHLSPPSSARSR